MNESHNESAAALPQEMQSALNTFKNAADAITSDWHSKLKKKPVPPVIYHYTTDIGLNGILGSGKLWLSDILSLNDPSELLHGFDLAAQVLDNEAKIWPVEYAQSAEIFKSALKEIFKDIALHYVCSFSKNGNDLSQWRAYADDGYGYALGFETKSIKKAFDTSAGKLTYGAGDSFLVTYNDEKLKQIYRNLIGKLLPLTSSIHAKHLTEKAGQECLSRLFSSLVIHVLTASSHFKHPSYLNESEYRFLKIHNPNDSKEIKLRPRNYKLIKYIEFDWASGGKNVLKEIIIGPAADFEKSKRFAEDCLRKSGIDIASVEISQSQIPYKPA